MTDSDPLEALRACAAQILRNETRFYDGGSRGVAAAREAYEEIMKQVERLSPCDCCGRVGDGSLCLACDQAIAMGKDPVPYVMDNDSNDGGGMLACQLAIEAEARRREASAPVRPAAIDDLANQLFIAALTNQEDWDNKWLDDDAPRNALARVRHILAIVEEAGGLRGSGGGVGAKGHSKRRSTP